MREVEAWASISLWPHLDACDVRCLGRVCSEGLRHTNSRMPDWGCAVLSTVVLLICTTVQHVYSSTAGNTCSPFTRLFLNPSDAHHFVPMRCMYIRALPLDPSLSTPCVWWLVDPDARSRDRAITSGSTARPAAKSGAFHRSSATLGGGQGDGARGQKRGMCAATRLHSLSLTYCVSVRRGYSKTVGRIVDMSSSGGVPRY